MDNSDFDEVELNELLACVQDRIEYLRKAPVEEVLFVDEPIEQLRKIETKILKMLDA